MSDFEYRRGFGLDITFNSLIPVFGWSSWYTTPRDTAPSQALEPITPAQPCGATWLGCSLRAWEGAGLKNRQSIRNDWYVGVCGAEHIYKTTHGEALAGSSAIIATMKLAGDNCFVAFLFVLLVLVIAPTLIMAISMSFFPRYAQKVARMGLVSFATGSSSRTTPVKYVLREAPKP